MKIKFGSKNSALLAGRRLWADSKKNRRPQKTRSALQVFFLSRVAKLKSIPFSYSISFSVQRTTPM